MDSEKLSKKVTAVTRYETEKEPVEMGARKVQKGCLDASLSFQSI